VPYSSAPVVREIRTGNQVTYDRVVVEFFGEFGSCVVRYVGAVVHDPRGDVVPLTGGAFLEVRIHGATFDNIINAGGDVPNLRYTGPHRIRVGLPNVLEIADAGDFEMVMGLGIGLDHRAGFRVQRLTSPPRLVVDVAH
jgi:hypothetical protein